MRNKMGFEPSDLDVHDVAMREAIERGAETSLFAGPVLTKLLPAVTATPKTAEHERIERFVTRNRRQRRRDAKR